MQEGLNKLLFFLKMSTDILFFSLLHSTLILMPCTSSCTLTLFTCMSIFDKEKKAMSVYRLLGTFRFEEEYTTEHK